MTTEQSSAYLRVAPSDRLTMDDPWAWLALGWRDFRAAPTISIAYGGILVLFGLAAMLILYRTQLIYLALPLSAGFMLLAPVLAVGLYEASRRLSAGLPVSLGDCIGVIARNGGQLSLMCGLLLLLHFFWIWLALLIFLFFFGVRTPSPDLLLEDLFFQPKSLPFLLFGTGTGFLLACVVFAVSAISIPMLVDPEKDVGIVSAVSRSVRVVTDYWEVMALWAGLIVVFTVAGFAVFMVGLSVTLPIIGYATWHCYRGTADLPRRPTE